MENLTHVLNNKFH